MLAKLFLPLVKPLLLAAVQGYASELNPKFGDVLAKSNLSQADQAALQAALMQAAVNELTLLIQRM